MRNVIPVLVVLLVILALWYVSSFGLNSAWQSDRYESAGRTDVSFSERIKDTLAQERPVMPSPHQVGKEIWDTTVKKKITSKRSLIHHAKVTMSSTLVGFFLGTLLGIVLAVAIVYHKALNKSLMPWIITSQTIPILAIAPMIIVVLNAVGIQGLLPKAFISMYLSFFPVAVGMVKGLSSAGRSHLDLMQTYNASASQTFWKLRLPTSLPFLFTSMKIAVAIALVGAIIAELPTGAVSGLGARLLAGSYYGQTVQIWSALVMASLLAGILVFTVGIAGRFVNQRMGLNQGARHD